MLPIIQNRVSMFSLTSLVLFNCIIQLSSSSDLCKNGEQIDVMASIDTQYIVSSNWAAGHDKTVIKRDEFLDGDFMTTAQNRNVSLSPSANCSYLVSAPEGYHVMVAILAIGLLEARTGTTCDNYVQFEGTRDGFIETGDGRYCSSLANGFMPDQNGDQLKYTEGQYVLFHQPPLNSSRLTDTVPIVCSDKDKEAVKVIVHNMPFGTDGFQYGFVLSVR